MIMSLPSARSLVASSKKATRVESLIESLYLPAIHHVITLGIWHDIKETAVEMAQVRVSEGVLEGELVESEIGGQYYSFKGIPYSEPPLGDLRFKAPVPKKPWNGVRSAKEFGAICPQYDMFINEMRDGSEDCLYLNVYTPDTGSKTPLAVMVWIHGGGFISGSGNDNFYGPEYLVRHGIVLVTFNYRLELLGFLCLDSKDVPGNVGFKDQVASLRWVKQNIHNFGGDPNNVTIFGESAGGASVSYHLISPMSKGLFKRVIAQSGCSNSWWSQAYNPRERARSIARQMGLDSNDDEELYDFFKSQPVEALIMKKAGISWADEYKQDISLSFAAIDEKEFGGNERFFYRELMDNLNDAIHEDVEIIAGYTTDEGLLSLRCPGGIEKKLYQANFISQYFVPNTLVLRCPLKDQLKISSQIQKYYFNDKVIRKENLDPLVRYLSMDLIVHSVISWVKKIASAKKNKIYLYKFSCNSERNVMSELFGASELTDTENFICHSDDLAYLFPLKEVTSPVNVNSKAYEMINKFTKLWTNFAKTGNPTPNETSGDKWNPYTTENEEYMEIGEKLMAGSSPDRDEVLFWEDLLQEYQQYLF